MKRIMIETAQNGYIASETAGRNEGMMPYMSAPHVFESFENLTAWLSQNLEKPKLPEIANDK